LRLRVQRHDAERALHAEEHHADDTDESRHETDPPVKGGMVPQPAFRSEPSALMTADPVRSLLTLCGDCSKITAGGGSAGSLRRVTWCQHREGRVACELRDPLSIPAYG
jgi:hypothetical protein